MYSVFGLAVLLFAPHHPWMVYSTVFNTLPAHLFGATKELQNITPHGYYL